ncbi:hypothetical protein BJ138DRAFT_1099477 [Hygrophoropsis aurantiaca]|uniref:Uncharacterized protein n=1 Tax=Hygrophoropsis aurantiaca TaxID=72124 RepID=A0ACB8AJ34_9AGAM|nr:hypothetical protein BJ138DRAFT_1099477 [Hygrophoropsis aurantiaca]
MTKKSRKPAGLVSRSRSSGIKKCLQQQHSKPRSIPAAENPDLPDIQTSPQPFLNELSDPNSAVVQLYHLINCVIRIRETEQSKLEERYRESLSRLAIFEAAFSAAKAKAKLAGDRLFAVRAELIRVENLECSSTDAQHASEYLDFIEEDKSWMRIHVETSIEHTAFPPLDSILAIACAAQEEASIEKVAAEHRLRTCYLQSRMHGIALEKTKKACQLAEQALALIIAEHPRLADPNGTL